jgi:hypothetical protein
MMAIKRPHKSFVQDFDLFQRKEQSQVRNTIESKEKLNKYTNITFTFEWIEEIH